jgi:RNA 3'-terminal phosphate cyclase (ATP)
MKNVVEIDGSEGEGGGQVLRSAISLATVYGRPLHITKIRAGRARPGLKRQHLTCIRAAAEICGGTLEGDQPNSSEIHFAPGPVVAGDYHFAVGSAGSACLVFQTVLWPLLLAEGNSRVVFEGGTHNPMAPPFDFIERCFLPIVRRMGAVVELRLESRGFMPAGGGRFVAEIQGGCTLSPISILERGALVERRATAVVANLPGTIAIRELTEVRNLLRWRHEECLPRVDQDVDCTGNILLLEMIYEHVSEMASAIGEREITAEMIAARATQSLQSYLASDAPVGEHLADQLVLPFALAGGGAYRTAGLSEHTRTNMATVSAFVATKMLPEEDESGGVTLSFSSN